MNHQGGCQCGAVRYEVELDLTQPIVVCNCSICEKHGLMLAFVGAGNFNQRSGEDNLTEYRFNTEKIAHQFCKTCGVESFAFGQTKEGKSSVAINVRTIDGLILHDLTLAPFDGKSR